jgi:hypothetical protein
MRAMAVGLVCAFGVLGGQSVSRFLSPEGLLLGITFTPSVRDAKT